MSYSNTEIKTMIQQRTEELIQKGKNTALAGILAANEIHAKIRESTKARKEALATACNEA
jgi:hypothetical protein